MLKTLGSTKSTIRSEEGVVGVCDNSRARHDGDKLDGSKLDGNKINDGEFDNNKVDDEIGKKYQKTSKSKKLSKSKNILGSDFFTPRAKLVFTKLRQVLIKTPILHHFDPKHHIQVETDVLGYTIGRVFSQLTLDNLGQWHPVAFTFWKMIPAKTRYETHNGELLAIIETFKT